MKLFGFDAYTPEEISERATQIGVAKARMPLLAVFMLAVCAGGFIGLGALYYIVVASDASLSYAVVRVVGGLAFGLGLILVVVAGAELFTGNNLLVMAWADGRIRFIEVLRNWSIVYAGNAVGALGLVAIVYFAAHAASNNGAVGETYIKLAAAKSSMPFVEAFFKGVLCNLLVCLAVWLSMAGHSVTDKILAIIFPISAFVAAGFEHSIANLYVMPMGILLSQSTEAALPWSGLLSNLIPVTLGNIAGGSLLVATVYHLIYNRALRRPS